METIVLLPLGIALWTLCKRQSRQQEVIGDLQATITRQREELDRLLRTEGSSGAVRLVNYSLLTAVGVYGCVLVAKVLSSSSRSGCDMPPTQYTPTPARHEGEECVVCMIHKRDTLFGPCRHLCVCWLCSQDMHLCPVCRQEILRRQFAFLS
ncbi:hypothetical protein TraAM80_03433 [Trypanosoma rangeli]|uniref:RING-type domain-containing protein n=1 Tax=Trypanosoma rangeli TaxID=5698 RepID=A0A422NPM7_TRYRA|nr:uncharacterized protein TraAM80_03433 [Trypanosoma rangeli]RNF07457.1 hypothetical protein TraAM80_03433 [Trypanosoma rangeli]|eukprot:RNF07457.1 hypothetical protein TraAM80_03433 [Trypanosoma rangeli]